MHAKTPEALRAALEALSVTALLDSAWSVARREPRAWVRAEVTRALRRRAAEVAAESPMEARHLSDAAAVLRIVSAARRAR